MSFFFILKLCPDFLLYVQRPSTDFYLWASSVFPFFGQKRQWQDLNLRIQRIIDFKSIALDHSATLSSHLLTRTSLSMKPFLLFSPMCICSVYGDFFELLFLCRFFLLCCFFPCFCSPLFFSSFAWPSSIHFSFLSTFHFYPCSFFLRLCFFVLALMYVCPTSFSLVPTDVPLMLILLPFSQWSPIV